MKNNIILLLAVFATSFTFGQSKEKIKGIKTVTIESKKTEDFTQILVEDNLEIFLVKGEQCALEVETDENLHEVIQFENNGGSLRIYTSKDVTRAKKLNIRVTYTDSLKTVTMKNQSVLNALSEIQLPDITINNMDNSKSFMNVNAAKFKLTANDKTRIELNLKSENATVELSKNAQLKALIAANTFKLDMYQKTTATIEGDVSELKLRLDNNSILTGKNLIANIGDIIVEQYANCTLFVNQNLSIDASGKAEINLYGAPKVEMKNFAGSATLFKREK